MSQATDALDGKSSKTRCEEAWQALKATESQGNRRLGGAVKWKTQKSIWASMTKAQSSLFTQMRTGHIGLRAYLFSQRVPGTLTPWCNCGMGRETVAHLLLDCTASDRPPDLRSRRDLDEAIIDPDRCRDLVAWVMDSGRLSEYALARNLGANRTAANNNDSDESH